MSENRIRNKIKFTSLSNISEMALKEIKYRWGSGNGGVEILIYNMKSPRSRRKSISIINISDNGLAPAYIYGWDERDYGVDIVNYRIIIDGVDFV